MKWDKTVNIVLFFLFLAFFSEFLFPVLMTYDGVYSREISSLQGFYSFMTLFLWIGLAAYTAWKKRTHLLIGGCVYAVLAYVPEHFLKSIAEKPGKEEAMSFSESFFRQMYNLIYAPFTGFIRYFDKETAYNLTRQMLPMMLIVYVAVQLFRFYRNAYLAQKLQMNATVEASNPDLAKVLGGFEQDEKPPEKQPGIREVKTEIDIENNIEI